MIGIVHLAVIMGAMQSPTPVASRDRTMLVQTMIVSRDRTMLVQATIVSRDSTLPAPRVVVVRDAGTGAPVAGARVRSGAEEQRASADGIVRMKVAVGDSIVIARVGYARLVLAVSTSDTITAWLSPPMRLLPVVQTMAATEPLARNSSTRSVTSAREMAQPSLAALVASMPGVGSRSARGEATWQLRGARAEQVLVTLDGVPLNDPATGIADASDLPLAALGSVRVMPGADGAAGGGAVGGTIALTSGDAPVFSMSSGAFGTRTVEGATTLALGGTRLRVGAAWHEARNDFPFINTDGAAGSDTVERRVNNDERRVSLFAAATADAAWLTAFASSGDRGLVGPMNVRSSDHDRALTDRLSLRGGLGGGNWTLAAGVRTLGMRYDNPSAPTLDTEARTVSPEADLGVRAWSVSWRAGVGADRLTGTNLEDATRVRGWAAAERAFALRSWRGTAGVRLDAIQGAAPMASPWLAIEGTGDVAPYVRVGQAFRAPTLYDLYFAAPQRLTARSLRPERTQLDAEVGVRARLASDAVTMTAAAFTRTVDDAIIWFPGNFTWSPSNVGRERTVGAEVNAQVSLRPLTLTLWGAATDAELEAGNLTLPTPYVPDLAGGLSAAWRAGRSTYTISARGIGSRAFTAAPVSAATLLPPVGWLDLAWSRTLTLAGTPMLVAAGVTNALDARWESVRRFPSVGRAWTISLTLSP